jgi:competence protein ComEC
VVGSPRTVPPPADVFVPSSPYATRTTMMLECSRASVAGRWYPARGRVVLSAPAADPEDSAGGAPDLGDRVQVVGILAPFGRPMVPGGFDIGLAQRRQGVRAALYTKHWQAVRVVEPGADRLRSAVGAIRRWAVARLDRIESRESRAVVSAILFSQCDLLRQERGLESGRDVERAFIKSGTAHFLSVSGLNVGMVAAVVLFVARFLGLGRRTTAVLMALVVLAYALATDLNPPVLRAAVLVWVLGLGWMLGRPPLGLNSLAAAAIVVLAISPGDLFTVGFQLSFGAVLGLLWLSPPLERALFRRDPEIERLEDLGRPHASRILRMLRWNVSLSLAASLVSIPLIANWMHMVAWLAPVGSLLLSPLVFVLMASGLVLVALGWTAPWLADLLAAVPDGAARATSGIVRALAAVPGGHFYVARFEWPWLAATYGLLALWVLRERIGLSQRRLAILALAAAALFLWTGGHRAPRQTVATFIAVGHGNANLLELPNGRTILYDAGSSLSWARAADWATAPAIWSRGIGRLDAVFLSHPHFDHFKDLLPLAERFGIRRVFVPPTFMRNRLEIDGIVVEALAARGIRVEFFSAGDRLGGTGEAEVRGLWPHGPVSQSRNINDGSLVLGVSDGGRRPFDDAQGRRERVERRLLLAGDIEDAAIGVLLAAEPGLRADALLWPHHGGSPEAVGRLAAALGSKVLVVSVGRKLPEEPLPPWVAERRIACYRTSERGTVTLDLRPEGVVASAFLEAKTAPSADAAWEAADEDEADPP